MQLTVPEKSLVKSSPLKTYSIKYAVHDRDNLGDILANYGIPESTIDKITHLGEPVKAFKKIMPGRVLELTQNDENPLIQLTYHYEYDKDLIIHKTEHGFSALVRNLPITKRNVVKTSTVHSSLFAAAQKSGMPANLLQEFIKKFSWDIDFHKDLREGDKISMVYEELYNDGKKVATGHLLAAGFVNHGKAYSLFRFTVAGETDYFMADGRNIKKRFLRAPVQFSHISSVFNPHRMHPILHRIRAHQGVDYAAASGTPIHATGNGRIIFRGRKGGYGNAVIIDHGNSISTLYGHMSRFSNKKLGNRVKQGELIGYVGSTGLATASHVHYEFRIHEKHYDPLKIKLPKSVPLPERYRPAFFALARRFSLAMGVPFKPNEAG